jgi:CHAT domain-containing protein
MVIYADMWLGNIYVKHNNLDKALNFSPYTSTYCFSEPLDPRDMEDVDSLTFEGLNNTDILERIEIFEKRHEILMSKIGTNHLWVNGSRLVLINLYQEYYTKLHTDDYLFDIELKKRITKKIAKYAEEVLDCYIYNSKYIANIHFAQQYYEDIIYLLWDTSRADILNFYSDVSDRLIDELNSLCERYPELYNMNTYHHINMGRVYMNIARRYDPIEDVSDATHPIDALKYLKSAINSFTNSNKIVKQDSLYNEYRLKMLDGLLVCYWFLCDNPDVKKDISPEATWDIKSFKFDFYNPNTAPDSITLQQYEVVNHAGITQLMAETAAKSSLILDRNYSDLTKDEQIYINLWMEKAELLKQMDFNEYLNFCCVRETVYRECRLLKDDLKFNNELYEICKSLPNLYYQFRSLCKIAKIYKDLSMPLLNVIYASAAFTSSTEEMNSYLCEYFKTIRFINDEYARLHDKINNLEFIDRNSIKSDIERSNIDEAGVLYDISKVLNSNSVSMTAIASMERVMQYENYDDWWYGYSKSIKELKAKVGVFDAFEDIDRDQKLQFNELLATFKYASSEQRRTIWNGFLANLENNISLAFSKLESNEASALLYNSLLIKKGILLNSDKNFIDALTSYVSDSKEFNNNRNEFLYLLKNDPKSKRIKELGDSLRLCLRDIDYNNNLQNSWEDVKRNLQDKQCAIEFGEISCIDGTKELFAVIIDKNRKHPQSVYIGKYTEILPLDSTFINHLISKLDEFIGNDNVVYFSPDGLLHQIPIENLITSRTWIRLSSTRELIYRDQKNAKSVSQIALFGGLNYNSNKQNDLSSSENREMNIPEHLRTGVNQLPFTKEEVMSISSVIKKNGLTSFLFMDDNGTERTLYSLLQSKNIDVLHFATHGYYYTINDVERLGLEYNKLTYSEQESDALFRNGLLLSGANANLEILHEINTNDGILTAYEVQSLNLSNLQLVVLSACQTGLGDISSDGVFGLQRGFKKAGASTLLMSLWNVDDRATQMLMTKFYEYFLAGKSKLESLALAQKYIREYEEEVDVPVEMDKNAIQREKVQRNGNHNEIEHIRKVIIKPFTDPRYWAAFVLLDALE